MAKPLDLGKSVYELVKQYPELKDVMVEIGFKDMAKPMALNTVGKIMTIPKGCLIKGFNIPEVLRKLEDAGFEPTGNRPGFTKKKADASDAKSVSETNAADGQKTEQTTENSDTKAAEEETFGAAASTKNPEDLSETEREALIRSYIERLSNGEDLESVRADFVKNFSNVEAVEIVKAEQAMISSGMPIAKVQSLCDIHSALFHGATREEQIENAEKEVEASRARAMAAHGEAMTGEKTETAGSDQRKEAVSGQTASAPQSMIKTVDKEAKKAAAVRLSYTVNHPVYVFTQENKAVERQLKKSREALEAAREAKNEEGNERLLEELKTDRRIALHYSKKGDLLYPLLASKYNVSGPSNVMWGVDDEIRDEFRYLAAGTPKKDRQENWYERVDQVLTRAEEMAYKEKNILLPLCANFFTEDEWKGISRDLQDYDPCFTEEFPIWDEAKDLSRPLATIEGNEVRFPVGHLTPYQLNAMLNTIPLEISFIDEDDVNRYFNLQKEKKLFKRPDAAIDREVYFCHPAKIEPMVRAVIEDLKAGKRDSEDVWMTKNGRPVLVRYMAVRDDKGDYVGTMEVVQVMDKIEKHYKEESF